MTKLSTLIVAALVLVSVGIGSYKMGQNSVVNSIEDTDTEDKLKNDLVKLTAKDFEEYQNLKSLEGRFKKADEILGKIVTVFLADLGLRLAFKPTNPANLETACPNPTSPQIVQTMATQSPQPRPTETVAPPNPTPPPRPSWLVSEKRITNMDRAEDILEEAKKNPIEDLLAVLKVAKTSTREEMQPLEGGFRGEINFFNHEEEKSDWYIYFEASINSDSTTATGTSMIRLTRKSDGKTFSESSTRRGELLHFQRVVGSNAYIIDIRREQSYIQIYQVGRADHWVGNYYKKTRPGEFKHTGQVTLAKIR